MSKNYISDFTYENFMKGEYFDLTNTMYHGGTTFSSGALPKWDLLNRTFMIKRCGTDSDGSFLTDYLNETLVYAFCHLLKINCAYYRFVLIKYFDMELNTVIECPAVITEIFPGELIYYRDIRRIYNLGSINDQIIDFTDRFKVGSHLNDLLLIDYIFNQQDRHSKNFGMVGGRLSPIYDSGSCLFYHIPDKLLNDQLIKDIPRHKTFGKRQDELLEFSLKYIEPEFSFEFDEELLKTSTDKALDIVTGYSGIRLDFIRRLMKARIVNAGQIYAKTRRLARVCR